MLKNSSEIFVESDVLKPRVSEAIVRTLLYFDIFNYPLKKEEIFQFLGANSSAEEIQTTLDQLVLHNYVYKLGEFFSVQSKLELADRRVRGNAMAKDLLALATKKAAFIGKFTFVRSVMARGSLSQG